MNLVKMFFSLVLKCLLMSSLMLPMPSIWAQAREESFYKTKIGLWNYFYSRLEYESMPTMTVACDASAFVSMMKRMTLMKPNAAFTISLVRDDSNRQMLCSSCSMVVTSMASGKHKAGLSLLVHKYSKTWTGWCWDQLTYLYTQTRVESVPAPYRWSWWQSP